MTDAYRPARLDHALSPRTGLTRDHWVGLADHLLTGAASATGPTPWSLAFPGPPSDNGVASDGLEGFARTLMLSSFRLAGSPVTQVAPWYAQLMDGLEGAGLARASGDPRAWPDLGRAGQPLVEASSIALALSIADQELWAPLSARAKVGLRDWLLGGLGHDLRWNNWAFFDASIAGFLERTGDADGAAARRRLLDRITPWYVGDGWYSDGPGRRLDYYNAWSFHFYLPVLNYLAADTILEQSALEIHPFLAGYRALFDSEGAPVYFGRSLTYRFATVAPFLTAHLLPGHRAGPGQDRLVASRTLGWFLREGAVRDGQLSVGWRGEQPAIAQGYSSGGSPLWGAKAFAGLLLPPEHPLWTEPEPVVESPLPSWTDLGDGSLYAHRTPGGAVTLFPARARYQPSWSGDATTRNALYSKSAYSSLTAPGPDQRSADNDVALLLSGRPEGFAGPVTWLRSGEGWFSTVAPVWHQVTPPRRLTFRLARALRHVSALWSPRAWRRASIGRLHLLEGAYEVRLIALRGLPSGTELRVGAYAVAGDGVKQQVAPVLGDLSLELTDDDASHNPFGAATRTPIMTAALSRSRQVLGFAVALDREEPSAPQPAVERESDRTIRVDFGGGRVARVTIDGLRMTATWL